MKNSPRYINYADFKPKYDDEKNQLVFREMLHEVDRDVYAVMVNTIWNFGQLVGVQSEEYQNVINALYQRVFDGKYIDKTVSDFSFSPFR